MTTETVLERNPILKEAMADPELRERALRAALSKYVLEACDLRMAVAHAMSLLRVQRNKEALDVLIRVNDKYREAQ